MNELTLRVKQNPGSIELNFDELETQLDCKLAEYKGAVFTEESKDIAKKEVAGLRKLKKDIDDARKSVKKEWMRPYDEFEAGMKRLIGKVEEPIGLIDSQVKAFEEARKAEKRKKIQEIFVEFAEEAQEYTDYITLDKIYDSKWENAGTSMKAIRTSIQDSFEQMITAVDTIKAMRSDKEGEALELYKRTMDMPQAISLINTYERNKAEALEREAERRQKEEEERRQREIERIREEERQAIVREERIREEERAKVAREAAAQKPEPVNPFFQEEHEEAEDDGLPFVQPMTKTVFYKVVVTPEEQEQVEMAFNSIGIYFERRDM